MKQSIKNIYIKLKVIAVPKSIIQFIIGKIKNGTFSPESYLSLLDLQVTHQDHFDPIENDMTIFDHLLIISQEAQYADFVNKIIQSIIKDKTPSNFRSTKWCSLVVDCPPTTIVTLCSSPPFFEQFFKFIWTEDHASSIKHICEHSIEFQYILMNQLILQMTHKAFNEKPYIKLLEIGFDPKDSSPIQSTLFDHLIEKSSYHADLIPKIRCIIKIPTTHESIKLRDNWKYWVSYSTERVIDIICKIECLKIALIDYIHDNSNINIKNQILAIGSNHTKDLLFCNSTSKHTRRTFLGSYSDDKKLRVLTSGDKPLPSSPKKKIKTSNKSTSLIPNCEVFESDENRVQTVLLDNQRYFYKMSYIDSQEYNNKLIDYFEHKFYQYSGKFLDLDEDITIFKRITNVNTRHKILSNCCALGTNYIFTNRDSIDPPRVKFLNSIYNDSEIDFKMHFTRDSDSLKDIGVLDETTLFQYASQNQYISHFLYTLPIHINFSKFILNLDSNFYRTYERKFSDKLSSHPYTDYDEVYALFLSENRLSSEETVGFHVLFKSLFKQFDKNASNTSVPISTQLQPSDQFSRIQNDGVSGAGNPLFCGYIALAAGIGLLNEYQRYRVYNKLELTEMVCIDLEHLITQTTSYTSSLSFEKFQKKLGDCLYDYTNKNETSIFQPCLEQFKNAQIASFNETISQQNSFTDSLGNTYTISADNFDRASLDTIIKEQFEELKRSNDINRERITLLADSLGIDVIFNFERAPDTKPTVYICNETNSHYEAYVRNTQNQPCFNASSISSNLLSLATQGNNVSLSASSSNSYDEHIDEDFLRLIETTIPQNKSTKDEFDKQVIAHILNQTNFIDIAKNHPLYNDMKKMAAQSNAFNSFNKNTTPNAFIPLILNTNGKKSKLLMNKVPSTPLTETQIDMNRDSLQIYDIKTKSYTVFFIPIDTFSSDPIHLHLTHLEANEFLKGKLKTNPALSSPLFDAIEGKVNEHTKGPQKYEIQYGLPLSPSEIKNRKMSRQTERKKSTLPEDTALGIHGTRDFSDILKNGLNSEKYQRRNITVSGNLKQGTFACLVDEKTNHHNSVQTALEYIQYSVDTEQDKTINFDDITQPAGLVLFKGNISISNSNRRLNPSKKRKIVYGIFPDGTSGPELFVTFHKINPNISNQESVQRPIPSYSQKPTQPHASQSIKPPPQLLNAAIKEPLDQLIKTFALVSSNPQFDRVTKLRKISTNLVTLFKKLEDFIKQYPTRKRISNPNKTFSILQAVFNKKILVNQSYKQIGIDSSYLSLKESTVFNPYLALFLLHSLSNEPNLIQTFLDELKNDDKNSLKLFSNLEHINVQLLNIFPNDIDEKSLLKILTLILKFNQNKLDSIFFILKRYKNREVLFKLVNQLDFVWATLTVLKQIDKIEWNAFDSKTLNKIHPSNSNKKNGPKINEYLKELQKRFSPCTHSTSASNLVTTATSSQNQCTSSLSTTAPNLTTVISGSSAQLVNVVDLTRTCSASPSPSNSLSLTPSNSNNMLSSHHLDQTSSTSQGSAFIDLSNISDDDDKPDNKRQKSSN